MKYSGVELSLDEVNRHLGLMTKRDDPMSKKYIQFDKSLLDVNPWYYGRDLHDFVYGKAKDAQWDASRKILSRFFSKVTTEDKDT